MRFLPLVIAGSVALFACSSSNPATTTDAGADAGDTVNCNDPRVQTYAPNLSMPGMSGAFTFVLVSSDPAPPANNSNVFVLRLLDAGGQPVADATVSVLPTMPLMSHGTSKVLVTANGDGTYTLQPLYLFMPGLWEIAITAQSGSAQDGASFFFCVEG
jgi:hypothetical protein